MWLGFIGAHSCDDTKKRRRSWKKSQKKRRRSCTFVPETLTWQVVKKNKVTPAVTVPLFLAVLPGVPRVVSKTLTALCAFFPFVQGYPHPLLRPDPNYV